MHAKNKSESSYVHTGFWKLLKYDRYVCVKMATVLDCKVYEKTFSMPYVDCSNGHVAFIVKSDDN